MEDILTDLKWFTSKITSEQTSIPVLSKFFVANVSSTSHPDIKEEEKKGKPQKEKKQSSSPSAEKEGEDMQKISDPILFSEKSYDGTILYDAFTKRNNQEKKHIEYSFHFPDTVFMQELERVTSEKSSIIIVVGKDDVSSLVSQIKKKLPNDKSIVVQITTREIKTSLRTIIRYFKDNIRQAYDVAYVIFTHESMSDIPFDNQDDNQSITSKALAYDIYRLARNPAISEESKHYTKWYRDCLSLPYRGNFKPGLMIYADSHFDRISPFSVVMLIVSLLPISEYYIRVGTSEDSAIELMNTVLHYLF